MKIFISYPPLNGKGTPLLGQNRQFQWFSSPTYIYPMVPASAATLLSKNGYDVVWNDFIAEQKSFDQFLGFFREQKPDLIAFETKTPVVKQHWAIIDKLKSISPETITVLMGDHVTALPEESFNNSKVDHVITGGDYDFLLLSLANHLSKSTKLEPGIFFREGKSIQNTGPFKLDHDLNSLPFIDRDLTNWQLYSEKNGNFKRTPGTYTMAGRDCWYHKCKFCSWPTLYPSFRTRSAKSLLDEIGQLIDKYHIKEIMDDTGTFPTGPWLKEFCDGMIERGYSKQVRISCNMRVNALTQEEYALMGKAGFRFILYGLESANQSTLERIDKGIKVQDIPKACEMAKTAGLDPHLTCMVGYPWESREDAMRTVCLAKDIFKRGHADTLQATIVIPYPGTPLFKECKKEGLLLTEDWDHYDMREPIMRTPLGQEGVKEVTQELYKVFLTPKYIFRKLTQVRSLSDLKFMARGAKQLAGHLTDFSKKKKECEACEKQGTFA